MAGRPVQVKADVAGLKRILANEGKITDLKPVISLIMFYAGCTYSEIGKTFGITRQMAETLVRNAEEKL